MDAFLNTGKARLIKGDDGEGSKSDMRLLNALKLMAGVGAVLFFSASSWADLSCRQAHRSTYFKFAERGRIEKRVTPRPELSEFKGPQDEVMHAFPGGSLYLKEKALSTDTRKAVMELVRLWTYTREVEFPVKQLENKQVLTLGLPLGNGYSIELVYHSNARNENLNTTGPQVEIDKEFILVDVHGVGPNGIYLKGSGRIRTLDGKLTERAILDLTDLPGISDFDFLANVPDTIPEKALQAFKEVAPRLSLFDKNDLWNLARTDSYYKLKWKAFSLEFTRMIRLYHWKGIGKTWVKYVTIPVLAISAFVGVKSYAPEAVETAYVTMQKAVSLDYNAWVQEALVHMSTTPSMTASVREQVEMLRADFKKASENDSFLMPLSEKYPFDLENRNRMQLSKEEYIWAQRTFDKVQNREVTVFYVAKVSPKTGRINVAVAPVDANKYQTLIHYLESQGELTIPLNASTGS